MTAKPSRKQVLQGMAQIISQCLDSYSYSVRHFRTRLLDECSLSRST